MIVAIGPVADLPSWNWVGMDTVRELSKCFHVEVFNNFNTNPAAPVVVVVKKIPTISFMKAAEAKQQKIIYIPIDVFDSAEQIKDHAIILRSCAAILSHADSLIVYFKNFAPTYPLEHTSRYTLPRMNGYKPNGFVLWVGGYQFVPFVLKWLAEHPLESKLVFCTDYKNKSAIFRAEELSKALAIPLKHTYEMHEWNETIQAKLMTEAKAAMDIKGADFAQRNKPPTKAQKYISSGIPFAINPGNNCFDYFRNRGFPLCSPNEPEKWFSEPYFRITTDFGKELRKATSPKEVGKYISEFVKTFIKPTANHVDMAGLTIHRI